MKQTWLFLIVLFFFACDSAPSLEKEVSLNDTIIEKPKEVETAYVDCSHNNGFLNHFEDHRCKDYGDSVVYFYQNYIIHYQQHPINNGNILHVRRIDNTKVLTIGETNSCFFMGMNGDDAIIDEGTGQMRTLIIYDLKKGEETFSHAYVGELSLENGVLFFSDQVTIVDESKLPECPEELKAMEYGIGYTELLAFDFNTHELTRTGKYECCYFE